MRERSLPISQVALRVYKLALQGGVLEAELSVVALRCLEEGHEIGRRGLHAARLAHGAEASLARTAGRVGAAVGV